MRTCATGEVVVRHDPTSASRAELRAQGAPSLDEVLAWAAAAGVAVNVEMKHDVPNRLRLVERVGRVLPQVPRRRAALVLRSRAPRRCGGRRAPTSAARCSPPATSARACPEIIATQPYVHALHLERTQTEPPAVARHLRRGLRVGVWTVNDPVEAADLVALGVRTLITDAPGALLDALSLRR